MKFVVAPHTQEDAEGNEGRRVTLYDLSPNAVKRVQLGLTPVHEGTTVTVLEEQSLSLRRHPAFAERLEFFLPAVKRQTNALHEFDSAMMDADNIILIKVRGLLRRFTVKS